MDHDFVAFQNAVAGQYSLERELGRGGMGIVYLAREVSLDRHVAIKVLPPVLAMRDDLRERFVREARTAARLSHPHIVPIHRVDAAGDYVYFAMGFVDGDTLTQRVRDRGPVPPADAARILREVAWALAYAHANGVIHRDVKPDNILVERRSGRALVTDFGIAQMSADPSITAEGRILGTAHYMSPEQAAGEPLDGRSDLYALGCVGFFALTGRAPYDAPSAHAVLAKHLTHAVPSVAEHTRAAPPTLVTAVERCMAKAPEQRWATGEALADALGDTGVARREIPAALRVWLTRGDQLKAVYALWTVPFLWAASMAASMGEWPSGALLVGVAPWLFHLAVRATETRRVLAEGYSLADLRDAVRLAHDRRVEEAAAEHAAGPSLLGRILRVVTYGALAVLIAALVQAAAAPDLFSAIKGQVTVSIAMVVAVTAAVAGTAVPGRRVGPDSIVDRLKQRFWDGSIAERWVRWLTPKARQRAPADAIDRPTEAVIGLAIADLVAALPAGMRAGLGDVAALTRRLEAEAAALRGRVALLDTQLASLGAPDGGAPSMVATYARADAARLADERAGVAADLAAARDASGRRLAGTVAALEAIRLDLLRLHAGTGDAGSLTATLAAARRAGDEIDAAVAAYELR